MRSSLSAYWKCSGCGFFNPNESAACRKCQHPNPIRAQNPIASPVVEPAAPSPLTVTLPPQYKTPLKITISDATEFLTLAEAADLLKLNKRSVQNLCVRGVLKRGVHWWQREGAIGKRFDRQKLVEWVKEGTGTFRSRSLTPSEMEEAMKEYVDEDGHLKEGAPIPMRRGYFAR